MVRGCDDIEGDFQFVFYFDGAAADFYRRDAVVGLQDGEFAFAAEFAGIGANVKGEADWLFDSVEIQFAGESELPAIGSFLYRGDAGGCESDLWKFSDVEDFLAFHRGLHFVAVFLGFARIDDGDRFGWNL